MQRLLRGLTVAVLLLGAGCSGSPSLSPSAANALTGELAFEQANIAPTEEGVLAAGGCTVHSFGLGEYDSCGAQATSHVLTLHEVTAGAAITGTFPIGGDPCSTPTAEIAYSASTDRGPLGPLLQATSGSLTVEDVSADGMRGEFTATFTFPDGGSSTLSGKFDDQPGATLACP